RDPKHTLGQSRSIVALYRVHDELSDLHQQRLSMIELEKFEALGEFPKPPHKGTHNIVPLSSVKEIVNEGAKMKHCISSYINDVFLGKYYAYHIEKPSPTTIGVFVRDGKI